MRTRSQDKAGHLLPKQNKNNARIMADKDAINNSIKSKLEENRELDLDENDSGITSDLDTSKDSLTPQISEYSDDDSVSELTVTDTAVLSVSPVTEGRNGHVDSAAIVFLSCILCAIMVSFVLQLLGISSAEPLIILKLGQNLILRFYGLVSSVCISMLLGLGCAWFSWNVIKNDSLDPGRFPPTPTAPKTLRQRSGHDYHLCYTMALLNGVLMFTYSLWWQRYKFLQ